jgi:hypothetical protein
MKAQLIIVALLMLGFTGCATTGKFEAKVHSWEDKDAQSLTRAWGQPDAIEKLSNGNHMFVYARLKHLPVAYGSQRMIASTSTKKDTMNSGEVYIRCATYFELTPSNKIVSTQFRGDECKSRD